MEKLHPADTLIDLVWFDSNYGQMDRDVCEIVIIQVPNLTKQGTLFTLP